MAKDPNETFEGDEFSNNLFSDLAPLLALFGERVATQYLRRSTQHLENVIFACAPLGILTAVTSAIRIGGSRKLKAMIGRVEEPDAVSEIELVSSTSKDVCELWNGVGLVRLVGKAHMLELVVDEDNDEIYTRQKGMEAVNGDPENDIGAKVAPNIALNTVDGSISPWELRMIALVGVVLQTAVLAFDGFIVYGKKLTKGGEKVSHYAYPFTFFGTAGVVISMYLCAYIIETSTNELEWKPQRLEGSPEDSKPTNQRVIWIQKSQTVGDQGFGSFAIYGPLGSSRYLMTSHRCRDRKRFHNLTTIASIISIVGFVFQFVGLRAMHFSASIAQLIATVIMTVLRVVIRRNISQEPQIIELEDHEVTLSPTVPSSTPPSSGGNTTKSRLDKFSVQKLTEGFELDIMAMQLARCQLWHIVTYQYPNQADSRNIVDTPEVPLLGEKVIASRMRLAELPEIPWHTELHEHAKRLSDTIAHLMNFVWDSSGTKEHFELGLDAVNMREVEWKLPIQTQALSCSKINNEWITLSAHRMPISGEKWKPWGVDPARIEAILQLWMMRLQRLKVPHRKTLWLLCSSNDNEVGLIVDWWIGGDCCIVKNKTIKEIAEEYDICNDDGTPDYSRIIGPIGVNPNIASRSPPKATGALPADNVRIPRAIIDPNMSLINLGVHYILYNFLCKLAMNITSIKEETRIETATKGTIFFQNEAFTDLALAAEANGSLTQQDAYRLIICAFHSQDKLPRLYHQDQYPFISLYEKAMQIAQGLRENEDDSSTKKIEMLYEEAHEMLKFEIQELIFRERWIEAAELSLRVARICEGSIEDKKSKQLVALKDTMRQLGDKILEHDLGSTQIQPGSNAGQQPLLGPNGQQNLNLKDMLLQCRADVNSADNMVGATGLDYALNKGLERAYIVFLLWGVAVCDDEGTPGGRRRAPLWHAIDAMREPANRVSEEACLKTVTLLLDLGANPNSFDPSTGESSLHPAAELNLTTVIRKILTHQNFQSSTTDLRDSKGRTALFYAAKRGDFEMMKTLLEHGADINSKDEQDGKTLLHHGAMEKDTSLVQILLKMGALVNIEDDSRRTALHHAARNGDGALMYLLLKNKANPHTRDMTGNTALNYARSRRETNPEESGLVDLLWLLERSADLVDDVSILHNAIYSEDESTISKLVSFQVDLNEKDKNGETALHIAARKGKEAIVLILLEHGAAVEEQNDKGETPLEVAVWYGHKGVVQVLLKQGAIVDAKSSGGYTALYIASQGGHEEIVRILLNKGADANQDSGDGIRSTPLYIASQRGHKAVVQALLEHGAIIDAKMTDGNTSLYVASAQGHKGVVQVLLEQGAIVDEKSNSGVTALYVASQQGHAEIVQVLSKEGANVNHAAINGMTPLYIASLRGHRAVVQVLLKQGAIIDAKMNDGSTPLDIASARGHKGVVQVLLEQGATINPKSNDGYTPLYLASQEGHTEIVQLLSKEGADVNYAAIDGSTPLYIASQKGHKAVVQVLLKQGAIIDAKSNGGYTPLYLASQEGHIEIVQLLSKEGADVNHAAIDGSTPLYIASQKGHKAVVQALLKQGAIIDAKIHDGSTPLYIASAQGHEEIVQVLSKEGADVNHTAIDGSTPLHAASEIGHTAVVQVLLEQGAIMNTKMIDGRSPLFLASCQGNEEIVRILLEHGAADGQLHYGDILREVALEQGHTGVVRIIESWRVTGGKGFKADRAETLYNDDGKQEKEEEEEGEKEKEEGKEEGKEEWKEE